MLELTSLKSNSTSFNELEKLSCEEQQSISGAAAGYFSGGTLAPAGAKVGGVLGAAAGAYLGSNFSRGAGFGVDGQRGTTTLWGGLGGLAGASLGGASVAE